MQHDLHETDIRAWIAETVARDRFRCEPMALSRSTAWSLRDGALRHNSGRFFAVVGLAWGEGEERRWQPFLDQREIGTLAFAVRRGAKDVEFLCHAKAEPGNVGTVQIAPTYQATASNTDKVHGGAPPPYADCFATSNTDPSASLQSEQGTRFFQKRNCNVIIDGSDFEARDARHRWLPSGLLRRLLDVDFLINTDARSVLVCSDWAMLTGGEPFGADTALSRSLQASYAAEIGPASIARVDAALDRARRQGLGAAICPVDTMPGWPFAPGTSTPLANASKSVRHIRVHSETREIADWDQPIFSTHTELPYTLLCGRQDGLLKFAFRPLWEPGLLSGAELAPSLVGPLPLALGHAEVLASVRQSDEGGRFFHDVAQYDLVDIGPAFADDDLLWLTLSEIRRLLPLGRFNNEARSLLSLVLRFL